jgi:hypothetical protein
MKNRNLLNRKDLKSFRSFIMNKTTTAEIANQPPRPQTKLQHPDHNFTAAAPPSKGGENIMT